MSWGLRPFGHRPAICHWASTPWSGPALRRGSVWARAFVAAVPADGGTQSPIFLDWILPRTIIVLVPERIRGLSRSWSSWAARLVIKQSPMRVRLMLARAGRRSTTGLRHSGCQTAGAACGCRTGHRSTAPYPSDRIGVRAGWALVVISSCGAGPSLPSRWFGVQATLSRLAARIARPSCPPWR